jgi:integrase
VSPAWIRRRVWTPSKRNPKGSRTYQVLYRRGGRGYKIEVAGSFTTEREAKLRRDLVAGWLAQGLNPADELARLNTAPPRVRVYREWAAAYQDSRVDLDEQTVTNMRSHLKRLLPIFGDQDPHTLTVADQIEAVATLSASLAPSSVSRYVATHRLILDFAGVKPNPARDPAVKLPQVIRNEVEPPSSAHVLAMLDKTPRRWRLPLIVLEQTAMAVGEAHTLTWGDVDVDGGRFRLRRANVKAQIRSRARWVQLPEWLMPLIDATCPPDDRTAERRVFPGFTPDVAKNVMARACKAAGIPHYHPHDLRHRRLSLWHGQGVPAKELAARAGHSKASITLDTYSHVMPLDEATADAFSALLVVTR